jgi:hypothetical protein
VKESIINLKYIRIAKTNILLSPDSFSLQYRLNRSIPLPVLPFTQLREHGFPSRAQKQSLTGLWDDLEIY